MPAKKNAKDPDPRPEYPGRSTGARLSRWVRENVPDRRIFDEGTDPVTMTGAELYALLGQVAERAYFWGADDVARPGWDSLDEEGEDFGTPQERVLNGMQSAHSDGQGEWLSLGLVAEYAGMQPAQAAQVLAGLIRSGSVEQQGAGAEAAYRRVP